MSSRSSSNITPRLTRKLGPGSSSPSTTQHYSLRRNSIPITNDQNGKIQKVKKKKKNSTASSISIIRKSLNTTTIDDQSSDDQMDDNNQVVITNDSDEETNGEIQIPNQRRHRSDSTASNQTEEPKQQKKTKKTIEDVMGCFTKTDEGLTCNLCINSRKVRLISSFLLSLFDGQKSACLSKSLLSLFPVFFVKGNILLE